MANNKKKLSQIVKAPKAKPKDSLDLDGFASFAAQDLGIDIPKINRMNAEGSFGGYNPSTNEISVSTKGRHPMDIYRTLAHEMIHHKQNLEGRIKDVAKEGSTGSDIENEANAHAGVIMRNYAKANPKAFKLSTVNESRQYLKEGVNDPGIFKAVFLAGGPGSGKDYILKQTIAGNGLTEINSDIAFEFLMKKNKLDMKMPDHEEEKRNEVRSRGKVVSAKKNMAALENRQGLIINGTGADPKEIEEIKAKLEQEYGYEAMMVYVATEDEVSRQRNIERGERGGRAVPEKIRSKKWKEAFEAKEHLKKTFGDSYVEVDNSLDLRNADVATIKAKKDEFNKIFKRVKSFSSAAPKSKVAKAWMESEAQKRGITNLKDTKSNKFVDKKGKAEAPQSKKTPQKAPQAPQQAPQNDRIAYAYRPMQSSIMDKARAMGLTYYKFGRFGKNGKVTHIERNGQLIDAKMAEETNRKFETLLVEKEGFPPGGAGEWGTAELTNNYRKMTPGEENRVYAWAKSAKTQERFAKKYGTNAQKALNETVKRLLDESLGEKKTIQDIRNQASRNPK